MGRGDNLSGTGENADRWNIFGILLTSIGQASIPFCSGFDGTSNSSQPGVSWYYFECNGPVSHVTTSSGGWRGARRTPLPRNARNAAVIWLLRIHKWQLVLFAPALGTYGNMGGIFSVTRDCVPWTSPYSRTSSQGAVWRQFRFEAFNIANHHPANRMVPQALSIPEMLPRWCPLDVRA